MIDPAHNLGTADGQSRLASGRGTTTTLVATAVVMIAWLACSIVTSALGLFDQPGEPPTYFALFLAVPVIGLLLVHVASRPFRRALLAVPLWFVTAVHSVRIVAGVAFVASAWSGNLPPGFAWPAGLGDIVAGVVAIPLAVAFFRGRHGRRLRLRYIAWNVFGLADLLNAMVVGLLYSVSVVGILAGPESNTRDATYLPMSIIPTFYVPVLILLHLLGLHRNRELS